MIINITDKCTMQCTHCLLDCKPTNKTMMSKNTLERVIDNPLFKTSHVILISGGEPTEHPDFFNIVDKILKHSTDKTVSVLSNGLWAKSKKMGKKMIYFANKSCFRIQITNDKAFYPTDVKRILHPSIMYEEHLRILDDLGRGKDLSIEDYPHVRRRLGPMCFNMRSILHNNNARSIEAAVHMLETMNKFCTVMFMPNGDLSLSECGRFIVGNVRDEGLLDKAYYKVKKDPTPCDQCGRYQSMDDEYKIF